MFQSVGGHSRQNSHYSHACVYPRYDAGPRVFEGHALLWRNSQSVSGAQKTFRVWLSMADFVDRHYDLRNRYSSGRDARLSKRPPCGCDDAPWIAGKRGDDFRRARNGNDPLEFRFLIAAHLGQFLGMIASR